jgi:hypothetical protein
VFIPVEGGHFAWRSGIFQGPAVNSIKAAMAGEKWECGLRGVAKQLGVFAV